MNQAQLGSCIFVTGSLVGRIETAKKVPTRDFSERVDAALATDGMFSRLVGLVLRSQLPHWFQAYAEMEAKAAYISTYQAQLVDGLLQTEEYARAVLGVRSEENLDARVAARCIECAPLGTASWRKSSYSGTSGGDCVEVADLAPHIAVRDSKNPDGPVLTRTPGAFAAFVGAAAAL